VLSWLGTISAVSRQCSVEVDDLVDGRKDKVDYRDNDFAERCEN